MSTYNLPSRIKIVNPAPNVDSQYGVWSSTAAAASSVESALRQVGLTVGVLESGSVVEYWWQSNTTDGGLVPKGGLAGASAIETSNINDGAITAAKLEDQAVVTAKVASSAITNAKLANMPANTVKVRNVGTAGTPVDFEIVADSVLGRLGGFIDNIPVLDEDDFSSDSSGGLPTQQSTKAYVDTARNRYGVQTLTIANQAASNTSLAIAATTDVVEVTRDFDWQPTAITGFTANKKIAFHITTSVSNAYPYQITLPSTIRKDDGVDPVFKNNSSSTYDILELVGVNSTSAQVTNVIYGG